MRHALSWIALAALCVTACDRTPSDKAVPAQQPVTNTNAMVNADPIAGAENAASVRQFPQQTRLSPTPARLYADATVRRAPLASDDVTMLKSGAQVTEVATDRDYYLVTFRELASGKDIAGWIYKDALTDYGGRPSPVQTSETCGVPEINVRTDREFCATPCVVDDDCKKVGGICDGTGKVTSTKGKLIDGRYCVAR